MELIITAITSDSNNNKGNNNNNDNKVIIIIKGRGGSEKKTETLQKTDQEAPNTKHCKTPTTCKGTGIHYKNNY